MKNNLKSLLQNKQKTISRESGYPNQSSGKDGDFQVRKIPGQGIFLFYKWGSRWYSSRMSTYRPISSERKQRVIIPSGVTSKKTGELSLNTSGNLTIKKSKSINDKIILINSSKVIDSDELVLSRNKDSGSASTADFLIKNTGTGRAYLHIQTTNASADSYILMSYLATGGDSAGLKQWAVGMDNSLSEDTLTFAYKSSGSDPLTPSTTTSSEIKLTLTKSGNLDITQGSLDINTVAEVGSDTDKFLTLDGNTVKYVDGANLLSYIGGSSTTGTVTSVGGTGTINGLTLTGTVTSSGNLTLGGTLAINNGDWSGTDLAIANGGTGASNSDAWLNSRITTNANGSLNYDATGATAVNHDSLTGFVAAEHVDWAGASAGTIHASNYVDNDTTYSVMASGNSYAAGLVAAGSGTHGSEFLRKDGTWVVPTDTDTNTNQLTTFTVSATTDSNATTISQGDDLMFAAGTGITCETTADGTVTISSTITDTNTQLSTEEVQDIVGAMFASNTETRIAATYVDGGVGAGKINLVVDDMTADTNTNQLTTFDVDADSGTAETIAHGNTLQLTGGTGISTTVSSTDTVTFALSSGAALSNLGGGSGTTFLKKDGTWATPTDTNTQNTTTLSFVDSSDDIILRNTTGGAGSGTDDIKFVAGSNITLTHTDADNITIAASGGGGGASALNDLSDVTYSSGDLTISSLDKIISGSLDFDSSGHINFDGCAAGFTRTTYADATNVTVDFRTGNKAHLDMTGGSITGTLTMQFPAVSGNFVLVVQQDGSTRNINAYATKDSAGNAGSNDGGSAGAVRWSGGSVPDLTDGGNKRDILSFYWDATEEVCYGVASLNF